MGDVVQLFAGGRASRPATVAKPEDWRILDEVELPGEAPVHGRAQRGVIERMMIDGIAGMFWIRLTGGPRGGSLLVVEGARLARPAVALPPISHG